MTKLISAINNSWHSLARAEPGRRFMRHYHRSQRERSIGKTTLRIALGIALTAGGVLLWFLPGPGWLLIMLGMAMFASESRRLAGSLDRMEMFLRAQLRRLRLWWRAPSAAP
jgi:hypothetical protein